MDGCEKILKTSTGALYSNMALGDEGVLSAARNVVKSARNLGELQEKLGNSRGF